jgi:hypothetical protein
MNGCEYLTVWPDWEYKQIDFMVPMIKNKALSVEMF